MPQDHQVCVDGGHATLVERQRCVDPIVGAQVRDGVELEVRQHRVGERGRPVGVQMDDSLPFEHGDPVEGLLDPDVRHTEIVDDRVLQLEVLDSDHVRVAGGLQPAFGQIGGQVRGVRIRGVEHLFGGSGADRPDRPMAGCCSGCPAARNRFRKRRGMRTGEEETGAPSVCTSDPQLREKNSVVAKRRKHSVPLTQASSQHGVNRISPRVQRDVSYAGRPARPKSGGAVHPRIPTPRIRGWRGYRRTADPRWGSPTTSTGTWSRPKVWCGSGSERPDRSDQASAISHQLGQDGISTPRSLAAVEVGTIWRCQPRSPDDSTCRNLQGRQATEGHPTDLRA